ncbi:MAG: transposase, partial [Gammaproteobacteria bacterium]|nr:transposase [Gammaproteobacteria bacterium]
CMTYIDLNPVRAGIAQTPETSEYTSIKERIEPLFNLSEAIKSFTAHGGFKDHLQGESAIAIKPLAAFIGGYRADNDKGTGIHFEFKDYLELLDFTGRAIRDDKRGHIDERLPPILQRLNFEQKDWIADCQSFEERYYQRFSKKRRKK